MFKFFRKNQAPAAPSYQRDPVGFLLFNADQNLAVCRAAIPPNREKRHWVLLTGNADTAFRSVLEKTALLCRAKGDAAAAKAQLVAGAEFVPALVDASAGALAELARGDSIHGLDFTHAFVWAMLAGDSEAEQRLVSAARAPSVREEGGGVDTGGPHDVVAKLALAVLSDDAAALDLLGRRYAAEVGSDRFFAHHFRYERLMARLVERDEAGFAAELREVEARFRSRADDRRTGHEQVLDGCAERNAWVFDVWATALLNLARRRGMSVPFDGSEFIPSALAPASP